MSRILKYRKLTIFATIIIIALGLFAYNIMPKQENPSLNVPFSLVSIEAIGLDSEEIDEKIIMPLRDELMVLEDIDRVEINSYDNYATMLVGFNIGVENADELNDEVASIIQSKKYGDNVKVNVYSDFEEADILYMFDAKEIKQANEFVDALYENDKIKKAQISDYTKDYYEIVFDNSKLSKANVAYKDLVSLIASKGGDYTLGFVSDKSIITTNNFKSSKDIEDIVVGQNQGYPIKVSDLATVSLNKDKEYIVSYNGTDSLFISVFFKDSIDITKLSDEIRDVSKNYPAIHEISFSPDDVDMAINDINTNLLLGMFLVLIVVLVGLGLRSAICIVATFPITVFGTILILYALGIELQRVSIAGIIISIGIIVDNAIVVIDSIKHELDLGNDMNLSVKNTIKNNSYPILTSTLTTIFAFSPLLFLPGVAGQMASSLPLTVIISLIISYLSAILLMPIIASMIIKPTKAKEGKYLNAVIYKVLKFEKTVIAIVVILFTLSIYTLVSRQPIQLFPTAQKEYVYVDFKTSKSNDIKDVDTIANQIIDNIEGDNVVKVINYALPSFYNTMEPNIKQPNAGRILFTHPKDISQYIIDLRTKLKSTLSEDVEFNIEQIVMNESGAPIVIQLESVDKMDEVVKRIEEISGVSEVSYLKANDILSYDMTMNMDYLALNQIQDYQVIEQVSSLINATKLEVMDIDNVDSNLSVKTTITSLKQLEKESVVISNKSYPINKLVTFKSISKPLVVSRYNFNKNVEISVFIDDNASVYGINSKVENVLKELNTKYILTGEAALTSSVFTDVLYAGIVALILIFVVLLIQFYSFKKVAIILSSIPIACIGSAIFLILFDSPITFTATLGIISLAGVVVNNGIILLDYIERHEADNIFDRCYESVLRRSRPIVISNITTIIGLVPLIIFGNDFFRPMAITMVGGLLVAIPLSLIVIPIMYKITYKE